MNCSVNKIELVSPAGGWDQLIAAINAGADAVYLGYKKFGARAYAENFDLPRLRKVVEAAHDYNVKVYLTLNTLLKDDELKEISYFLNEYLGFCQDGIIIQDFGLYKAVRDIFGNTRVHASTQLNIHNSASYKFLNDQGFARVVLAREMTLDEIDCIYKSCSSTGKCPEIEVFGHGSQCYCYSGSCYFSSFTGLRSGNRGRCTQPCRMKYSLMEENSRLIIKDSYMLSKKDLSVISLIPEIAAAKVDAIKIEGRAKSAEYVGIITSIYRKYLDMYYADPKNYRVSEKDIYKVSQIFSREMGPGYFAEQFPQDIISMKKSGSVGNFLGRVRQTGRKYLIIKSDLEVAKDDILEVWTNKGNSQLKVMHCQALKEPEKNKQKKIYPKNAARGENKAGKKLIRIETDKDFYSVEGDRVFKFYDKNLDMEAKNLYLNGLIPENKKNVNKNDIKNKAVAFKKSSAQAIENYFENMLPEKKESVRPGISLELYSIKDAHDLLKSNSLKLVKNVIINSFHEIFADSSRGFERIQQLNGLLAGKNINTVIKTPNIIYDESLRLFEDGFDNIIEAGITDFSISNCGIFKYISDFCRKNPEGNKKFLQKNKKLGIYLGHQLNIFNIIAVKFFIFSLKNNTAVKIKNITLSSELSLDEIGRIINHPYSEKEKNASQIKTGALTDNDANVEFAVYSYGYYPVMISRFKMQYLDSNYIKTVENEHGRDKKQYFLSDRKGYRFRILSDYNDSIIFLNSKKICNLFDIAGFLNNGVSCFLVDSRTFDADEIKKILEYYSSAIEAAAGRDIKSLEKISETAAKSTLFSDFTRGHFFRKVT